GGEGCVVGFGGGPADEIEVRAWEKLLVGGGRARQDAEVAELGVDQLVDVVVRGQFGPLELAGREDDDLGAGGELGEAREDERVPALARGDGGVVVDIGGGLV